MSAQGSAVYLRASQGASSQPNRKGSLVCFWCSPGMKLISFDSEIHSTVQLPFPVSTTIHFLLVLPCAAGEPGSTRWIKTPLTAVCLVAQLCLTLRDRMDCAHQAPLSMGILQARILSGLPCPSPKDLPNLGIEPRSPALQANSLSSEPPGKSMNTGVGSLSLLEVIFLIQELNWGLLHCKQIIYQLSYQRSL